MNQELTSILLQGKGLDSITQVLGKTLKCNVRVENQHGDKISGYGAGERYSFKKIMDSKSPMIREKIQQMLRTKNTISLHLDKDHDPPHIRMMTPIIIRNQIQGYISFIKENGKFHDLESAFIERAANIYALQILNERTAIETEQRLRGDLLEELLSDPNQQSFAAKRLIVLGYDLNTPHFVFIFQAVKLEDEHSMSLMKGCIINILTQQASSMGRKIVASARFDRVNALIPEDFIIQQNTTERKYAEELLKRIEKEFKSPKILITISNKCENFAKFHNGYKEALKAIEIAKIKEKEHDIILFSELGHLAILLDARRPEELGAFADKLLRKIYEYDEHYSTEFLKTLYYYINNECNLYKTSRVMNVSISGLRYRLARIKDLTDIDLSASASRFEIQMALEIYVVFGKLQY